MSSSSPVHTDNILPGSGSGRQCHVRAEQRSAIAVLDREGFDIIHLDRLEVENTRPMPGSGRSPISSLVINTS